MQGVPFGNQWDIRVKESSWYLFFFNLFKKRFYLFLRRGEGKDKEWERNINVWLLLACPTLGTWVTTQACALTGNRTHDPWVHSRTLSTVSHTSQGQLVFVESASDWREVERKREREKKRKYTGYMCISSGPFLSTILLFVLLLTCGQTQPRNIKWKTPEINSLYIF